VRELLSPSFNSGAKRRSTTGPVILNVTEGGVKDLLYLSFKSGAKRRSAKSVLGMSEPKPRRAEIL
jgi:hypothetical protein